MKRVDNELPNVAAYRLIEGRKFQLWAYVVSHGMLWLRSPKTPGDADTPQQTTNIDIVCADVIYLSAPRFLGTIKIVSALPEEVEDLRRRVGRPAHFSHSHVLALENECGRHHIVLGSFHITENDLDIFDSPPGFNFDVRMKPYVATR